MNNSFNSLSTSISFPSNGIYSISPSPTVFINSGPVKTHLNLDILADENAKPGDVLVIGEDGVPKWGMIDISLEKTLANPALRGALDKLIEAYEQYKMIEKLSEDMAKKDDD
jgi:hypothetical protein